MTDPGSRDYLYSGEVTQSKKGRHPNNLAALAMATEQRTRAFLAQLGVSPENAAVSLKAAKDALLKSMPEAKTDAKTQDELFKAAKIVTLTTGRKALKELLDAGQIQRIGKGIKGNLFLYWKAAERVFGVSTETLVG
jgi:hypothetical protein